MLSSTNVALYSSNIFNNSNVSALDYSSNVGIGFTFNPTLSINISSSDLVISNLKPGTTEDSNSINVSVATNAAYGYTLSANVGDDIHNNSNLTHSNNTDIFSSIATDANLSSLDDSEDSNIWGYSYKNNTLVSPVWSNYNGLSSSGNTVLLDANTNSTSSDNSNNNSNNSDNNNNVDSIDFKIAAKASSTQPSGKYTGTINFYAITKPTPMNLAESYFAHGKTRYNGYYTMQDMTTEICNDTEIIGEGSQTQLIDIRDNKVYWATKLADNHCWMTQNLDLDLSHEVALTSETSDIDPESYGTTIYTAETGYSKDKDTGVVSWLPSTIVNVGGTPTQRADTIVMNGDSVPNWANDYSRPYSADPGERYWYTNPSTYDEHNYTSLETCANDNNNDTAGCRHSHLGNYYNWSAAVANNNTSGYDSGTLTNSVCPKNWDLPVNGAYGTLMQAQSVWSGSGNIYATDGFNKLRTTPLYYQRFGLVNGGSLGNLGSYGLYWSSTGSKAKYAHDLSFIGSGIWPGDGYGRDLGFSVRCMAN